MTVDGADVDVVPGDMIFIDKGEVRGIRAVEELLAFAVAMI
jgi:quercetin dioxygenase-like cupin family protein